MFKDWLSGELRSWYVQSPHKDRIDFVGARLQELKYLPVVVRLHLHEWVRFVRHLEEHALPLPCSVHDPEVPRYLAVRFPSGSPSRRRGIRSSIRIFLEMDAEGRFSRRVLAPRRVTNALFQQAVPLIWTSSRSIRVSQPRRSANGRSSSPCLRATSSEPASRPGRRCNRPPSGRSWRRS